MRESIDEGLSQSHFGAVVLSEAFFEKDWTQYELNGLTAREIGDESVILPIWYRVGRDDVLQYSPPLADCVAITPNGDDVEQTAEELTSAITSILRKRLS